MMYMYVAIRVYQKFMVSITIIPRMVVVHVILFNKTVFLNLLMGHVLDHLFPTNTHMYSYSITIPVNI